ncbi:MAG: hypothetical protein NBKEAIPA_02272 [Nitrospirae bacterium]|nr:hypothetical protein [Nitrospirota bacterium]MCE7964383.1 hypothetical protein [Nitrospira sp. NTP2]MCK6493384.1 hypothetical protein [Nitrospira sp.]MEB2337394.1 hypothetical protein [Nitrospirales bacterium]QOJ36544.1 MAG: hypothetical protein HRU82_17025 [Nitrospira sp.]
MMTSCSRSSFSSTPRAHIERPRAARPCHAKPTPFDVRPSVIEELLLFTLSLNALALIEWWRLLFADPPNLGILITLSAAAGGMSLYSWRTCRSFLRNLM